jgi:hypothetical protein
VFYTLHEKQDNAESQASKAPEMHIALPWGLMGDLVGDFSL